MLASSPGPPVRGADSRSRFVEAFHQLLRLCSVFYEYDDDTTRSSRTASAYSTRLKEMHLLLTQGAHNQYGDLPWTARHEMLMTQWILARPEMRDFLPTRTMVAYPEAWMDRVEAMNKLQGWSDSSVLHFRDLAVFGEQLLLGIRFGAWTTVIEPGAGGELGALLAGRGPGLHPRVPGGDRRRPDPAGRSFDAGPPPAPEVRRLPQLIDVIRGDRDHRRALSRRAR